MRLDINISLYYRILLRRRSKKVKVSNIDQEKEVLVEVRAVSVEPVSYSDVVNEVKAAQPQEAIVDEGFQEFNILPKGYVPPSNDKEKYKKPSAKKAASAPIAVFEDAVARKNGEPVEPKAVER